MSVPEQSDFGLHESVSVLVIHPEHVFHDEGIISAYVNFAIISCLADAIIRTKRFNFYSADDCSTSGQVPCRKKSTRSRYKNVSAEMCVSLAGKYCSSLAFNFVLWSKNC